MARRSTTGRHEPFFFLTQKIGELYRDRDISISFLSNISSTNSWMISWWGSGILNCFVWIGRLCSKLMRCETLSVHPRSYSFLLNTSWYSRNRFWYLSRCSGGHFKLIFSRNSLAAFPCNGAGIFVAWFFASVLISLIDGAWKL